MKLLRKVRDEAEFSVKTTALVLKLLCESCFKRRFDIADVVIVACFAIGGTKQAMLGILLVVVISKMVEVLKRKVVNKNEK